MRPYDDLEMRDPAVRDAQQFARLRAVLGEALGLAPGLAAQLGAVDVAGLTGADALARLAVLRKADLPRLQADRPPLGGFATRAAAHLPQLFMSPGPVFEPGGVGRDWWRMGRFLHAAGVGPGDIVQNCFSYHLTPAGQMTESGAAAVGASVIPAGPGQTDQQVEAAARLGATAYAGTPDFLKVILDRADAMGRALGITKAVVSGGALFPSLRAEYAARGVACLQCYASADLGLIAYEAPGGEGMIVDEGVILEIVRPGTGDPVPAGEVGEVVVTALNPDYPLVRFATGDLSAVLPGQSPCGRTNMRISGWMGRADQTTKIKGMFVRPEQVAALVARHPEVLRARVIAGRAGEQDTLTVQVESTAADAEGIAASVQAVLKLRGTVEIVAPGSLPNDGKVIEDRREYS